MSGQFFSTNLGRFRIISFTEGLSFLFLLGVAMPLKYSGITDEVVKIGGWFHGCLFISYVILLFIAFIKLKWSFKNTVLLFIASLLPFGFLMAEYMFLRKQAGKKQQ